MDLTEIYIHIFKILAWKKLDLTFLEVRSLRMDVTGKSHCLHFFF